MAVLKASARKEYACRVHLNAPAACLCYSITSTFVGVHNNRTVPMLALYRYACRRIATNRRACPLYILQEVRDCRRVVGNGLVTPRDLSLR